MLSANRAYKLMSILLILMVSLPIFISICYAVPGADDFCNGNVVNKLREDYSILTSAVLFSKDFYMNWQGTYLGAFFVGLQPSVQHSFFTFRAILFCCFTLFVLGLFLAVLCYSEIILKLSIPAKYIFSAVFSIMVLNSTRGIEWFTWYGGCSVYQLPMICYLYALVFFLLFTTYNRIILNILSSFLSFLGAGGSLAITSLGSSLLLLTWFFVIDKSKIKTKYNLLLSLPFFMSFVGGLVNCLAPGNFVRYYAIDKTGELHVFSAFVASFSTFLDQLVSLNRFSFVFFLGIIFIVVYNSVAITISLKRLFLIIAIGFTSIILVVFPVLLGYSTNNISNAERVVFTFNLTIIIYAVVFTVALASYLRQFDFIIRMFKLFLALKGTIAFLLLIVSIVFFNYGFKNGYAYRVFRDLKHGYIQDATATLEFVYSELAKSKNLDVVVNIKPFYNTANIYLPGLSENPNSWINLCTAAYYGARSCTLKYDTN